MTIKLGTIITHIGHAPPESDPWGCVCALDVDVVLAKKSVHKLYFEFVCNGSDGYSEYYDVFFVPNNTESASLLVLTYAQ